MLLLDGSQEFLYDFRMLCRYIMIFVDIRCQVVETWLALYHYHLPVALSHANLVGLVEFPVEIVVVLLLGILAQKGTLPALMCSGHQAMNGMRMPPS